MHPRTHTTHARAGLARAELPKHLVHFIKCNVIFFATDSVDNMGKAILSVSKSQNEPAFKACSITVATVNLQKMDSGPERAQGENFYFSQGQAGGYYELIARGSTPNPTPEWVRSNIAAFRARGSGAAAAAAAAAASGGGAAGGGGGGGGGGVP